jgi:FtsZ-binding cell division protein ZapB
MTDKTQEFIEKLIDQRLGQMVDELKHMNQLLESFKTTAETEIKAIHAKQETVASVQRAFQQATPRLLAGQWPRRDGDSYGNHPGPRAPVTQLLEPEAKTGTVA